MYGFVDECTIEVFSGHGGKGRVSFRREKYVPKGGPDGGDGGAGGDIIFEVKNNLKTLSHLRGKRFFKAQDGEIGGKKKMHGKDGENLIITVPPGTVIKDVKTGKIIKDLHEDDSPWTFLHGGRGGKGNTNFATSTHQTPRFAQPGMEGEYRKLIIELNMIADIGFVGYPNAGKSTLLSVLTNANPKIASYPFTTKIPNLGVMAYRYATLILADMPGIIDGASEGAGMGIEFLKHIARTKAIAYLVDLSSEDSVSDYKSLANEVRKFNQDLFKKKRIIIATKNDLEGIDKNIEMLKNELKDETIVSISSLTMKGIKELKEEFLKLVS